MSTGHVEVTIKQEPQKLNYSAIKDNDQHEHDVESSEEEAHFDNDLIINFLHKIKRKAPQTSQFVHQQEITSNIISICMEYIGDPAQITLEKELNIDFKLLGYDNQLHIDDKIGCIYGCKDSQHFKSCILTIFILIIIFWAFICDVSSYSVNTCNISLWYDQWWLIILCLLYVLYLIEFVMSSTTYYLYNMFGEIEFKHYIEQIKLLSPRLWLEFESVDPKKITNSKHFVYSKWSDASDDMQNLYLMNGKHNVIKLKIDRFIVFEDGETATICNGEMDDYVSDEVRTNGSYFDRVHKHWAINDDSNKKRILLHIGDKKPFTLSFPFYIITSCLLCSICFRCWFSSKTAKRRYKIVKQISL